jgi:hypothetical protein
MRDWNVIGLFCDDIREEKSGQDTIIGIMPDHVNVPSFPGVFAKLGVYVRIHLSSTADVSAITAALHFPTGEKMALAGFDRDFIERQKQQNPAGQNPIVGLISKALAAPLLIREAGRLRIVVTFDGEEEVCGTLNVQAAPSASVTDSPPPVSQSPPASPPT